MRKETAMGVLLRLTKRFARMVGQNALFLKSKRFARMVGQNALFLKSTNSVIMLKSCLNSRFKCHICRKPCFLLQKNVFRIRSDNFLMKKKTFP